MQGHDLKQQVKVYLDVAAALAIPNPTRMILKFLDSKAPVIQRLGATVHDSLGASAKEQAAIRQQIVEFATKMQNTRQVIYDTLLQTIGDDKVVQTLMQQIERCSATENCGDTAQKNYNLIQLRHQIQQALEPNVRTKQSIAT